MKLFALQLFFNSFIVLIVVPILSGPAFRSKIAGANFIEKYSLIILLTLRKVLPLFCTERVACKLAAHSAISQIPQPLIFLIQKDKSADDVEYQVSVKLR